MKSRILIADDHPVVRQGVTEMLSKTADLRVTGEAVDGEQAERMALSRDHDMLLLDISLPVRRGVQVLESLRACGSTLPVLFFSMYSPDQYADYALRAGAQGFVSKDASEAELLRAIRCVLAGGTSFPGGAPKRGGATGKERSSEDDDPFAQLSRREYEVMEKLAAGVSAVDIATSLDINPRTVATYRVRLLRKLGIKSNAELATLVSLYSRL